MDTDRGEAGTATQPGSPGEVFRIFLRLGVTSFGGPVAHLAYFRAEFVERRRWMTDAAYADLVALCQFLPGPASSQAGFAIGLARAGWAGALAAFAAFTLPSALLLVAFAHGAQGLGGPVGAGLIAGLKIVAVAVVAHAVWGMAQALCPDRARQALAVAAVAVTAALPGATGQVAAIALGAASALALRLPVAAAGAPDTAAGVTRVQGLVALAAFAGLLVALPLLAPLGQALAVADAFYRAGALVFGGGHVVLPLLEAGVVGPGWVAPATFLAGYGAAQAVPGPLFTFAAFLGAAAEPAPHGVAGAALALIAVFLPGFLILIAALPFRAALAPRMTVRRAMAGANAAVVGVLGAALHSPVFTAGVTDARAFALALALFVALAAFRVPALAVVAAGAAGGVALASV
jgi:chromate transporter